MNEDLRRIVHDRLDSESSLDKDWAALVLAACDGQVEVDALLRSGTASPSVASPQKRKKAAGAYLTSLTVQGFRGIGSKQTLTFSPGPGLTIVIGRNGSGKSSFSEALEVLFTGDSKRWFGRSKIWKEGWRNLHQAHPSGIEAELLLEEQGVAAVVCTWDAGSALEAQKVHVQPRGKAKTSVQAMGWREALVSYRPFLSYNELGSMLDEGPSKLYDALSLVLGLEELVGAQATLSEARLSRQRDFGAAEQARTAHIAQLEVLLTTGADDRATACLDALASVSWGLDAVEAILGAGSVPAPDQDVSLLNRALALEAPGPDRVRLAIEALRGADGALKAVAGSSAETSRQLAGLLDAALKFHAGHDYSDCPVCGARDGLSKTWADSTRKEITRLLEIASGTDDAHRAAQTAMKTARELLIPTPSWLAQLLKMGLQGADVVAAEWALWQAGQSTGDLLTLAEHLQARHASFAAAIETLREAAAADLKQREDRWRPIAAAMVPWIPSARLARDGAVHLPRIKTAEAWLKDATDEIRNQRFTPIADKAMATWEHLRQQSNVTLGRIELAGAKSQRRVTLDVTVDGIPGAALGVMSQGELHSLALSLFLPRATLPESPFRFVVIDDPVQSMDPARVDGLARAIEETAASRQVIVFTHDERLPEAVRRLNIKSTILSLTRRPKSVVEIRTALDPVRAHIEDALALVHTTDLPKDVLRTLVPGFCRSALEAAFMALIRRRRFAAGESHNSVEEELKAAGKLTSLAALGLFDDREKGGDVMRRLNQIGTWAGDVFKQSKDGVHDTAAAGDLKVMIEDAEKLAGAILSLK